MHQFYRNEFFNFEALRILGMTSYGGAEVAEFLEAVGHIRENDAQSWHNAWSEQSEKAERLAENAKAQGQRAAARFGFLRASNYARASVYMLIPPTPNQSDHRVVPALQRVTDLFTKATNLFEGAVHWLQIPYENDIFLPANLYLPPSRDRLAGRIPWVVTLVGADSLQEEIFYTLPAVGPELGYAVLTFEGPGQGRTLHEHGLALRPDWETVTDIVMQYLAGHPQWGPDSTVLDWNRVAVAGASLGAYFALRSAAGPRFQACIAVDPPYDFYDLATKHLPPFFVRLWVAGWISDSMMDAFIHLGMWLDFRTRWDISTASRFLGAVSPSDLLRIMRHYTLKAPGGTTYLDRVHCPVLVTGAANSLYFDPSETTQVIFDALPNPRKEMWVAQKPGEGSLQAKVGAMPLSNQRVFQFLDKQFGIQRDNLP